MKSTVPVCWVAMFRPPQNNESYYLANRTLGASLLGLTLLATQVGGGMLIGIADITHQSGWLMGATYAAGQMLGFIGILLFFSRAFSKLKLLTTPEIFDKVYGAPTLRKAASALSAFSLLIILIAQAVAMKKLFAPFEFSALTPCLIWFAIVLYTALGGFLAVVKTDLLQIALIFVGLGFLIFHLPTSDYSLVPGAFASVTSIDLKMFIHFLLWPCLYLFIEQDMVQRFSAAKDQRSLKIALLITLTGIALVASVPLVIGLLARTHHLIPDPQTSVLITFAQHYCHKGVVLVVFFTLLMAIISTTDSLLCAISSLIACDGWIDMTKSSYLKNVAITLAVGGTALLGALFAESVFKTLIFSYGLTASALFVPVLIALCNGSQSAKGATGAFFGGMVSYCIFTVLAPHWTLLAIVFSAFGFLMGLALDKYSFFQGSFLTRRVKTSSAPVETRDL